MLKKSINLPECGITGGTRGFTRKSVVFSAEKVGRVLLVAEVIGVSDEKKPLNDRASQKIAQYLALFQCARVVGNVSRACEIFGVSRDTYYRMQRIYLAHGEQGLIDQISRQREVSRKHSTEIERLVIEVSRENPQLGRRTLARTLREQGVSISPSAVRSVLIRNGIRR